MEKATAPHSSTLAWKIPWMEEPGGLQSMGSLRVGTTERLHFHFPLSRIGGGNGNPLQCSCLENPRDGRAWWAAIYGVTQGRARLKRLSGSSKMETLFYLSCNQPMLPKLREGSTPTRAFHSPGWFSASAEDPKVGQEPPWASLQASLFLMQTSFPPLPPS